MTRNLYVLEKVTPNEIIELEKKKADIVTFDYASHKQLVNHRIIHDLLDNYFEDREREMIFKFCSEYLLKLENFDNHKTAYHDVNLVNIVDRNELLESMMDIIPQAHVLKKILEKEEYDNVYVSSRLFEIFYKSDLAKNFIKFKESEKDELTYEKITIPVNISQMKLDVTVSRKKYQEIKKILEKLTIKSFSLSKNNLELQKMILVELDPEIYYDLLKEINENDIQPILVNFRKSTIYSKKALNILRETNSLVFTPDQIIDKNISKEINNEKNRILNYLKDDSSEKQIIPELCFGNMNFTFLLKRKIIDILLQRIDEYLNCISIAEKLNQDKNNLGVLMLNNSGETEKIFSNKFQNSCIYQLQHAFANYLESISYFDILDDFHNPRNNMIVWGDIIKNYLIDVRKFPKEQILVTGSPKYDSFHKLEKKLEKHNRILVTLRPIISHMEGLRLVIYDRYEEALKKIIQFSDNHPDIEIIFKLHPQQNVNNEIIKDMIRNKKQIKVLQSGTVKYLLTECDLVINIATDNFDASSVILEAMLLEKPVLNIELQKNVKEFEFLKDNAIEHAYYDSNIEKIIMELFDEEIKKKLINNSKKFLTKYLVNYGNSSKKLIENIKEKSTN